MTRKALRKKRREQAKWANRPQPSRTTSPWMAVGAVVASAALTAARPTTAHAATFASHSGVRVHAFQSAAAPQDQPARQFDIAAGPIADVLAAFESTAGIRVLLALDAIGMIHSPGVSGLHTVQSALDALLAGTGLTFRFTSPEMVTLELRVETDAIRVTGARPASVVSSPKYVTPLREVPQTVEVIPRGVIEKQAVTTLSEALRNVPGITLQAGEGGGASNTAGDMFNLRGFNASNNIFVDGVRDDGLISRDVYNLDQVEVFMGPTGTDVGRGTAAGYINMQTKTPGLMAENSAFFTYGSGDQKRFTVDVNQPLGRGRDGGWLSQSAVRFNALWQDGGVNGRSVVTQERRAVAPSLALGLGTPTRVTLAAQIMRQDNLPDYGIPGAAWEDEPLTPTTIQAPAPVDQSNFYGSDGYDYDNAQQDSYTARIEHDFSPRLTLRNQTRYNRAEREAIVTTIQNVAAYDTTTNLVTLARQGNIRENEIASNLTSAVARFATGRLQHASTAGIEYTAEQQESPVFAATSLGTRAPADIFAPNPHEQVVGYAPVLSEAWTKGKTNTVGLFVFDTVQLSEKWQVNGGLRWEYYDTTFRSVDAAGLAAADLAKSDGLLSSKAGLMFKITPAGNVYVSYGTAMTPPGTANFTLSAQPNNVNNPSVEPQASTNYEAGSKWDLASGRLSVNTAVFRTENRNVIFTVDATTIPPIYNQDDRQTVNGVSVGSIGRFTEGWEVFGNFAYLDSTFDTQLDANSGNRLTLTPKYSGSIWSTYRLPFRVTVGGGVRVTDEVYVNAANTIRSPGYTLVDGLVEYEVNQYLSLRLNVVNATNEAYIQSVNNNGGRYNPGQPRTVFLTSNVRF